MEITLRPLEPSGLPAFVALHDRPCFGGCYCAVWTAIGPDWSARCAARTPNRQEIVDRIERGEHVGFLVERAGVVVGWTGSGPRAGFPRLHERKGARIAPAAPTDWIVGCLAFVPEVRGQGLADAVLDELIAIAWAAGATCIDAFPVRPWDEPRSYRGSVGLYLRHGFVQIAEEPDEASAILVLRCTRRDPCAQPT